jgi:hypothetical protein
MPMLLEDLAAETTGSFRRAADRLAEEARDLRASGRTPTEEAALRPRTISAARQATGYAVSRLPEAEAVWESALAALVSDPLGPGSIHLLQSVLSVFEGGRRLCQLPRDLWARVVELGATPDPTDDLDRAQARFDRLASDARKAIDHREKGWQPADPERFARAMQEARDGKYVSAEEARRWFRPN